MTKQKKIPFAELIVDRNFSFEDKLFAIRVITNISWIETEQRLKKAISKGDVASIVYTAETRRIIFQGLPPVYGALSKAHPSSKELPN